MFCFALDKVDSLRRALNDAEDEIDRLRRRY